MTVVPTITTLISRCNFPSSTQDISSNFSFHELVTVLTHANNEYKKGKKVIPDPTFDFIAQTVEKRQITTLQQLPHNLHKLKLTELNHLKVFCDATYAKGQPKISNQIYNLLASEITKRNTNISQYTNAAKTNPFVSANWSDATLFDVICGLNSAFDKGTPLVENKCYDIITKELSFRPDSPTQFPPHLSLPPHWSFPISDIDQIELMPDSTEFARVKGLLNNSLPAAVVHSIKRIQNYGLYRMWQLTKFAIAYYQMGRVSPDQVNTRELFHGCANQYGVDEIIRYGFYRQYCPNGAIGDGCYYALNASYSNNPPYVLQYPDGSKQLFLVQVIVGNSTRGHCGMKKQPALTQSVDDGPNHMYCIFDHFQAYPEYVIHYSN